MDEEDDPIENLLAILPEDKIYDFICVLAQFYKKT